MTLMTTSRSEVGCLVKLFGFLQATLGDDGRQPELKLTHATPKPVPVRSGLNYYRLCH